MLNGSHTDHFLNDMAQKVVNSNTDKSIPDYIFFESFLCSGQPNQYQYSYEKKGKIAISDLPVTLLSLPKDASGIVFGNLELIRPEDESSFNINFYVNENALRYVCFANNVLPTVTSDLPANIASEVTVTVCHPHHPAKTPHGTVIREFTDAMQNILDQINNENLDALILSCIKGKRLDLNFDQLVYEFFTDALNSDENSVPAMLGLAYCHAQGIYTQINHKKSQEIATLALNKNPNSAAILCFLGHYLYPKNAVEYFEKAIQADPDFAYAWARLGYYHHRAVGVSKNDYLAKGCFEVANLLNPTRYSARWLAAIKSKLNLDPEIVDEKGADAAFPDFAHLRINIEPNEKGFVSSTSILNQLRAARHHLPRTESPEYSGDNRDDKMGLRKR